MDIYTAYPLKLPFTSPNQSKQSIYDIKFSIENWQLHSKFLLKQEGLGLIFFCILGTSILIRLSQIIENKPSTY